MDSKKIVYLQRQIIRYHKDFTNAYPNTDFQVITPENIAEFLGGSSFSY